MPETFSRDTVKLESVRFIRDPGGNTRVIVEYTKATAVGTESVFRGRFVPLNPTRQAQANGIWDDALAFVTAQEA